MNSNLITKRIEVSGVVQGVGFRPFLFSLAEKYDLKGEVSNTSDGVRVLAEGSPEAIEGFCSDIIAKKPVLALITELRTFDAAPGAFSQFKIVPSEADGKRGTLISPDVAVCQDCLSEMRDTKDRRFEYPFINCTNCGPRFTIIEDVPYDRPKTAMKSFPMCPACQAEYDDPADRRFHAQPNACPVCGPEVFLTDNNGRRLANSPKEAIELSARYLSEGYIVAIKGLGGFHLACDAGNEKAVRALRERKKRPHKPFALMAKSVSDILKYVHVSPEEQELLEAWHRPIVLLRKKQTNTPGTSKGVASSNPCLGIMLPYTPLHYLLLEKGPSILVMTSGNRSGEPLSIDNKDALDAFSHIADYFLLHNRDIYFRADDSIIRVQADKPRFIRRSRGYAPLPLILDRKMPKILACGAGMKNTVCLTRGKQAFLSQHIGDLFNIQSLEFFKSTVNHLKRIFDIEPEIIAHDLHPDYMSTIFAKEQEGAVKIGVQHHHAHAAACMAENHLDEPVLAITLDGTGYGTDGNIWGGEILLCSPKDFERKAHLSYIKMPGGDAAVLEPWRMAASVLYEAFGRDFLKLNIPYIKEMDGQKPDFVIQMIEKNLNSPLTSSCGRLFDAVASLLCICHAISHEGQAAMQLEALAHEEFPEKPDEPNEPYDFNLIRNDKNGHWQIDMIPCIREIVNDLQKGVALPKISAKFHDTLVLAFAKTAAQLGQETGIQKIVLSGGVFNNDRVLNQMLNKLKQYGFKVYTHSEVPTGDGGISLGQAVIVGSFR